MEERVIDNQLEVLAEYEAVWTQDRPADEYEEICEKHQDQAVKTDGGRRIKYTEKDLIRYMKGESITSFDGATPPKEYWTKNEHLPSHRTFIKRFGTYNAAVKGAGLEPRIAPDEKYTTKDLLRYLKGEAITNFDGNPPPWRYWDDHEHLPSSFVWSSHFYSYKEAVEAAGLEPRSRSITRKYMDEDLIRYMKGEAITNFNGHPPPKSYWRNDDYLPSASAFEARFGSYNEAARSAGLEPNEPGPGWRSIEKDATIYQDWLNPNSTITEIAEKHEVSSSTVREIGVSFRIAFEESGDDELLDYETVRNMSTEELLSRLLTE